MPTTTSQTNASDQFIHAGGGAGLILIQLSALIPGLLPTLALCAVFAAILIVPLIAVALAGTVVLVMSWSAWRLTAMVVGRLGRHKVARATGVGSPSPDPSARSQAKTPRSSGPAGSRRGAIA
jgi:hypothetical protein